MSNFEWILNTLKYLGLFIATGSSIWGATNVISKEVDGKKRLTYAGKISIILTIVGLLVSTASNIIQDRLASIKSQEASIKEINKTNRIILAGQPLLSLNISLKIEESDDKFRNLMLAADSNVQRYHYDNSQGEVSGSKGQAIYLANNFFPLFMASLKKDLPQNPENFLLLISLDNEQTAVLSFGYLDDSVKIFPYAFSDEKGHLYREQVDKISGGITFKDDLEGALHFGDSRQISNPFFHSDSESLFLKWNINPNTLFNCLSKYNSNIPLNANLPPILKILILYNINSLPFDSANVTSGSKYNIWDEVEILDEDELSDEDELLDDDEKLLNHIYSKSSVELIPNQLSDQIVHYNLKSIYQKQIQDPEWLENIGCNGLLLTFEREN